MSSVRITGVNSLVEIMSRIEDEIVLVAQAKQYMSDVICSSGVGPEVSDQVIKASALIGRRNARVPGLCRAAGLEWDCA